MVRPPARAIIIDKNAIAVFHLSRVCESMGLEVQSSHPDSIIDTMGADERPGILLIDLSGFDMDESTFVTQFDHTKRHRRYSIVLTNPAVECQTLCREHDAAEIAVLPKPLDLGKVSTRINAMMGWHRHRRVFGRCPGLILEDVEATGIIIQKLFDILGVNTVVCDTVHLFQQHMDVIVPELVTLDLSLPDGDARDLCKQIRRNAQLDELPIAIISGSPDRNAIIECLRLGANDHIPKPIIREEFFARISNLLKISSLQKRLVEKTEEMESLAFTDGLTKLFNRAYMDKALCRELERSRRINQPLGFLLMDLDYFKQINDTHGHEIGDDILVELGAIMQSSVRSYDIPCRYGGEEFCVLLPGTTSANVVVVAERIRTRCEQTRFTTKKLKQTISIGTAVFPETSTETSIISDADKALYSAKQGGRNRTITSLPKLQ